MWRRVTTSCSTGARSAATAARAVDLVDLVTHSPEDEHFRRAASFRIVSYQTPRGSAAWANPKTNPLVPLDSTAPGSKTPTSKAVIIRLERASSPPTADGTQEPVGR